jgi:hypothetical protein
MTKQPIYFPTADWSESPQSTPLADLKAVSQAVYEMPPVPSLPDVLPIELHFASTLRTQGGFLPPLPPAGHVLLSGYDHGGRSAVYTTPANVGNRRTYRAARQGNFAKARYYLLDHCGRRRARRR